MTASGDRPLNLLMHDCKEIIAVDANPFQNALCELKKTALSNLDYDNYLAFIGAKENQHRLHTLKMLEKDMNDSSIQWWRKHTNKINSGVLYQGTVEKFTQKASFCIRAFSNKKTHSLFSFSHLDEQREFVEKSWNSARWKKIFELVLHPLISRFLINDPGLYAYVDPKLTAGSYIHHRLEHALSNFLSKESVLLSLLFQGKVFEEGFSPYLRPEGVAQIKGRADRLSCHTGDVITYLEGSPDESFDCFSFSDIASYMKKDHFHRMVYAMYRTAKPGARFCIRQFLSNHQFPEELRPFLQRQEPLEKQLEHEDSCFVYSFMAGTIVKPAKIRN